MFLPQRLHEYILLDSSYNCYFLQNGILKKQPLTSFNNTTDKFYLPEQPDGWQNIQISFSTNNQYWMLNRSFTVPLNFITSGAEILRNLRYKGKGFSEMVYLLMLRKNRDTGVYEAEYQGMIDLSKASDDPLRGFTAPTKESGLLSFFEANVNTTYDLPFDENNPNVVQVENDGMFLSDKYNYSGIEVNIDSYIDNLFLNGIDTTTYVVPLVWLNKEGDSVGIIYGSPTLEKIPNDNAGIQAYAQASSNYFLETLFAANNLPVAGNFDYQTVSLGTTGVDASQPPPNTTAISQKGLEPNLFLFTNLRSTPIDIYTGNNDYPDIGKNASIPFSSLINLAPNEKLFLGVRIRIRVGYPFIPTQTNTIKELNSSTVQTTLQTRNTTTVNYGVQALYIGQQLIDKISNGTGRLVSNYLAANNSRVLQCGDAIRQTDKRIVPVYYGALSFSDWFSLIQTPIFNPSNPTNPLGCKIIGNTIYVEPRDVLNNISAAPVFNLGEVSGLKIDTAEEFLFNVFKCGYPNQSYDQNAGKYEFNSTHEYGMPTIAVNTVLDVTSKIRGDARGIEGIRGELLNKDTTDNSGDKQIFVVDVDLSHAGAISLIAQKSVSQTYAGAQLLNFDFVSAVPELTVNNNKDTFTYNKPYANRLLLKIDHLEINSANPVTIEIIQNNVVKFTDTYPANASTYSNQFFLNIAYNWSTQIRLTAPSFEVLSAKIDATIGYATYQLYRENFTSFSNILDASVYNTRISPHCQFLSWAGHFKSVGNQQQADIIKFNTGEKNTSFSRTVNGYTITENASETIGNMPGNPYFLPYVFKFTSPTPYTFAQTVALLNSGYFQFSFNGITLYGLAIGNLSSKPTTSEPQEWSLLAAPNNMIAAFMLLNQFTVNIQYGDHIMSISDYNPVQFLNYNKILPADFRHKDLYDDWAYKRFPEYLAPQRTLFQFGQQKWQTTDVINLQFMTSGEGQLKLFIYDDKRNYVNDLNCNIITNSAVPSPFILQQISFSLDPGLYLLVVKSRASDGSWINLAVSEWQEVKVKQPKTFAFDYTSSYNKLNTFFNTWGTVRMRINAQFAPEEPNGDFTEYQDESGNSSTVHDLTYQNQVLEVGSPGGLPDYQAKKINMITLLDGLQIEGKAYSRDKDSKMANKGFRQGYPFSYYTLSLRKTHNEFGLTVITDQDISDNLATSFIVDPQAVGMNAGNNITVNIQNT